MDGSILSVHSTFLTLKINSLGKPHLDRLKKISLLGKVFEYFFRGAISLDSWKTQMKGRNIV